MHLVGFTIEIVSENMVLRGPFGPKREIVLSPVVQRPGHKVDHSPPSSAEVKIGWTYTSVSLYAYIAGTGQISTLRVMKQGRGWGGVVR